MPMTPDIVNNAKLETEFHDGHTSHVRYRSGRTLKERRIRDIEEWRHEKHLGRGAFGVVWLESTIRGDGEKQLRAVKSLSKNETSNCYTELEAFALFSHPKYRACFVESFGWYEDANHTFIAMEYFPDGDLQKFLQKPLREPEAQGITSQVLQGLTFMHKNNFAHRDLKPANILVKCVGPDWWVKISDFGISKRVAEGQTALRTKAGTMAFAAPEVFGLVSSAEDNSAGSYTFAVDIWSLGAITFNMLTGTLPFNDLRQLAPYVVGIIGFPVEGLLKQQTSEFGCDFVVTTMSPEAHKRPDVGQLAVHRWMQAYATPTRSAETKFIDLDDEFIVDHPTHWSMPSSNQSNSEPNTVKEIFDDASTTLRPGNHHQVSTDLSYSDAEISVLASGVSSATISPANTEYDESMQTRINLTLLKTGIQGPVPKLSHSDDVALLHASSGISKAVVRAMHEHYHLPELFERAYAELYRANYADAEKTYKEGLVIIRKEQHKDDLTIAQVLSMLSLTQIEQEKYELAEKSSQEALDILKWGVKYLNKDLLFILLLLHTAHCKQRKYLQAKDTAVRLLSIYKGAYGSDDENTIQCLLRVGWTQYELGKFLEAEELFHDALRSCRELYKRDNETMLDGFLWLGKAQNRLKLYPEGERSLKRAVYISRQLCDADDERIAESLRWLGKCQYSRMKYRLAKLSFQDATHFYERIYGAEHELTILNREQLNDTITKLKSRSKVSTFPITYRQQHAPNTTQESFSAQEL